MKMEAEARGLQEKLVKQAEGFARIVAAAGGDPAKAANLMITDKMEDLVRIQVDAIKNIKFDNITVWDSNGKEGSSTANFVQSIAKAVPPMRDLYNMAGMELPEILGKEKKEDKE